QMGNQYPKPVLVLFSGEVSSACGLADAAVGPFYCPGDSKVYIDLDFYKDMQKKLNAPGEFARRVELLLHVLVEVQVDVHLAVAGAVERPDGGVGQAAGGTHLPAEEHQDGLGVLVAHL